MEGMYLLKKPDSIKKRKRIGRGSGSGHGKTSGRGQKGQLSRAGSKHRPWFEGGQMPLQRRIPKRGFNNVFKKYYQVVNISSLEGLKESDINPKLLKEKGIIKRDDQLIKILGNGNITRPVNVIVDAFSKSASEKIKKAGGTIVIREYPIKKES